MKSSKPETCDYCMGTIQPGQYFERYAHGPAVKNEFAAAPALRGNTDRGKTGGLTIAPNPGAIQATYSTDERTICRHCLLKIIQEAKAAMQAYAIAHPEVLNQ